MKEGHFKVTLFHYKSLFAIFNHNGLLLITMRY